MKSLLVLTLLLLACIGRAADQPAKDFTGHYELAKSGKSVFSLDVEQKGKTATMAFSASHFDGSGAAPDGDGEGQLNAKGELVFKWTDSFLNGGTAVLRRDGKRFRLSMEPLKVEDSRCMVFYGDILFKRTSTKAP
jgi:hypothetical protein